MKPTLFKWQYGISLNRNWNRRTGYVLQIWCCCFTAIPPEGQAFGPKDYQGFIWVFRTPHASMYYTFLVPNNKIIRWFIPYGVYRIPIAWAF